MDIRHLRYFIAIVDHQFNLTEAAKSLFVSQPTLSIVINNFESNEGVSLFERTHWRIIGLSPVGKQFYADAKQVVNYHQTMMHNLRDKQSALKGKITLGIPPILSTHFFAHLLPKLMAENPEIHFDIKEAGSHLLQQDLLLGKLTQALLLTDPKTTPQTLATSTTLTQTTVSAFMSPRHPLATRKKLHWHDFQGQKLVSLDDTFQLYHAQAKIFQALGFQPRYILHSQSWLFLINFVKEHADTLVLLPASLSQIHPLEQLRQLPIKTALSGQVSLARLDKKHYSNLEQHVYQQLLTALPYLFAATASTATT